MSVPSSGSLSMQSIACEKVHDNYGIPFDAQGLAKRAAIGRISLFDVSRSGNTNNSTVSYDVTNIASSSSPNNSAPYKMSEFYGYDHDASMILP